MKIGERSASSKKTTPAGSRVERLKVQDDVDKVIKTSKTQRSKDYFQMTAAIQRWNYPDVGLMSAVNSSVN